MSKTSDIIIGATISIIVIATMSGVMLDAAHGEDDDLYVFVLTGQSNAAYFRYDVSVANAELPKIGDDTAFYYGTSEKPIYYGVNPSNPTYDTTFESYGFQNMVNTSGDYVIGNIEAPFAAEFVKETGKRIYLINTAIGGQSITNMIPGAGGDDYAREVFAHAMSKIPDGYDVKLGSILFLQGETDTALNIETYKTDFVKMFDSYKEFAGFKSLILCQTRPADGVNSSAAQLELCDEVPGVYLGSTAPSTFENGSKYLPVGDVHYTQYGDDVIGKDMASCYVSKLYRSVGQYLQLVDIIPLLLIAAVIISLGYAILNKGRT